MMAKGDAGSGGLKGLPVAQAPVPKSTNPGSGGDSEDIRFFNLNVRAFIFKALQIVVLSRTGNKFAYNSQKIGGSITNCYLSLEDDPEVAAEIKRELSSNFMLGPGDSVTLEIYVELLGREVMSLEVWHFHMAPPESANSGNGGVDAQQQESVIHSMNRLVEILGLALKSLLCITRVLPAYRLARDPGENSLKFLYKISPSPPPHDMTGLLGANPGSKRILCALTEMGRFELHTHYRTPLIFHRAGGGNNRAALPRCRQWPPDHLNEEEEEDEETQELTNLESEPVGRSQRLRSPPPNIRDESSEPTETSEALLESLLQEANRIEQQQQQSRRQRGEGAAESTGEEDDDKDDEEEGEEDLQFDIEDAGPRTEAADEDHSLDLPFALDNGDVELNRLLSDLHRAAELEMFRSNCSASQQIECIEQQLEIFEKELKEFDDMIVYQDPDRDMD